MNGVGLLLRESLRRLRRRPLAPLLSVVGIAAGAGLLFAVQLENTRLTASYQEAEAGLAGTADRQVIARSHSGFDQRLFHEVAAMPSVRAAAPLTQHDVVLEVGGGKMDATLLGVDQRLRDLGGSLARQTIVDDPDESALGLYMSATTAQRLGVGRGGEVEVRYRGRSRPVLVARVLPDAEFGGLGKGGIVLAPLGTAQHLTGGQGRISRILVALDRKGSEVDQQLSRLAAKQGADLFHVGEQSKLLAQAAAPQQAGATLFSAISVLVGALLAFNAILLSVLQRRRELAVMRLLGAPVSTLVAGLLLEALLIGVTGTALGVTAAAVALAQSVQRTPVYLEAAFAFAPQALFPLSVVLVSSLVGVAATILAALYPARVASRIAPAEALRADGDLDGAKDVRRRRWRPAVAGALAIGGAGIALSAPAAGLPATVAFLAGSLFLLPLILSLAVRLVRRTLPSPGGVLQLGAAELAAVPSRTAATAAIGAVTVLLLVLVGGLTKNIEDGTKSLNRDFWGYADLWLTADTRENVFITRPFNERWVQTLRRNPLVQRAVPYRGAFLNWDGRRVLAFGVSRGFGLQSRNELFAGDPARVGRALAGRDAVVMASSLARAHGLAVGDRFELPTPTGPRTVDLVGTISSYGWAPGAIAMDARRFADYWGDSAVSAVQVRLRSGVEPEGARRELEALIPPRAGLRLETATEGWQRANAITSESLSPLRRISVAVGLAAILAAVAVMLTAVAQRSRRLSALRALGMSSRQVYAALLGESALVMVIGAAFGLGVGLAAQALSVRWLSETAGFHISFAAELASVVGTLGFAALIALLAGGIPARRAVRGSIATNLGYE